jgi:hypothetical protein
LLFGLQILFGCGSEGNSCALTALLSAVTAMQQNLTNIVGGNWLYLHVSVKLELSVCGSRPVISVRASYGAHVQVTICVGVECQFRTRTF